MTEKPMAKLGRWREYGKRVYKAGVGLLVVKQNRKTLLTLLSVQLQKIDLQNLHGSLMYFGIDLKYYDQALWRRTSKYDGGAFMNRLPLRRFVD